MKTQRLKRLIIFFSAACFIFFMARWAYSADVTLTWDANTESFLAGYKVYQAERSGNTSTAWDLVAVIEANDQGIIPNEYTVTVDSSKNWAWQVTAFDTSGNESGVSNMVELVDRTPPQNPTNLHKLE